LKINPLKTKVKHEHKKIGKKPKQKTSDLFSTVNTTLQTKSMTNQSQTKEKPKSASQKISESMKHQKKLDSGIEKIEYIDYKDLNQLKFSLSERYKIMPRRLTGNCKRHQEVLSAAIKRARQAAFIPYVVDRKRVVA